MARVEEAAEKAVLGAALVNENVIPEIVTRLKPDDFYYPEIGRASCRERV